jgi:hypothetical protein
VPACASGAAPSGAAPDLEARLCELRWRVAAGQVTASCAAARAAFSAR